MAILHQSEPKRRAGFPSVLERNVYGDRKSRMHTVVHVVSVIHVVHIDIVGPIPDGRPGFWAWIDHVEPEAPELETRGTLDHHDRDVVDAKPVSTAKMGAEAIFRNAVSVVAAAFVPGAMLALPIVGTLALPDVLPYIAWSRLGRSYLMQLRRGMPTVRLMLGAFLNCVMGFVKVLVPLFRTIFLVFTVLRFRFVRASVLVNATFLLVGTTTFVIFRPAVLCSGKHC
jgi:hypothetical protein